MNTPAATQAAGDALAFANAAWHARQALHWRRLKASPGKTGHAGRCEAHARRHEHRVREIALQSELALASRAAPQPLNEGPL